MNNINWKVRFKNPYWWLQVGIAIITPILAYLGINASDITTWSYVWALIKEAVNNPYLLGLIIISVLNTINDPTTPGLKDSASVLRYVRPGVIQDL